MVYTRWDRKFVVNRLVSISTQLDALIQALNTEGAQLMASIDDIQKAVEAQSSVIDSVETLIEGLVAQVQAAGVDPAKVQAVLDGIAANSDRLAAAVAKNTASHDEAHAAGM